MALADDLRELGVRSLAEMDAGHDYYTHTKRMWRLFQKSVREGRKTTVENRMTGTVVDQDELSRLAHKYVIGYLTAATFQHFVTLFEDFFFDLLRLWLSAYPESLSSKQLTFGDVLRAPDVAAVTLVVVEKELNEVKYKRVAEWFTYLDRLVKLNCPTPGEIEQIAEIKASRDVLVHNRGFANAIYVARAGDRARARDGQRLSVPERYHRESWETIKRVIQDLSQAAIRKA